MMEEEDEDICRVCRASGSPDKPLFHPCICTGSIRHVHQDCLVQWLRHSRKEYCELCNHRYTFKPVYSPDMPSRLPVRDLLLGLSKSLFSAVKCWIHYTLVAIAWLGIVPLTASRIYSCVFAGSVSALASLPRNMLSTSNVVQDVAHGFVVVGCSLIAFIGLIWLRLQVVNGDMPAWLIPRQHPPQDNVDRNNDAPNAEAAGENVLDDNNNANQGAPDVQLNDVQEQNNVDVNDVNWNGINWERAGDDPTWERILGLDGSLLFIEHVFWVVAINTLFIVVFAFCPYHLGHFFMVSVGLNSYVVATKFEGVLTTLCGYILVACGFLVSNIVMQRAKFHWPGRIFGFSYVIVKVGLLVLVEIGVFPLVCGLWLDICSLKVFNCTLQTRQQSYLSSPGTSIFLHWVVGMVFVFYFATFLMLVREVLRPGALWFLRNLNDPDFNPINEMIQLPVYRHSRRFVLSIVIFGTTIIIIAWLPVQLLLFFAPTLFPYNATAPNSSAFGEIPLQIMTLQFLLPGLLEQANTKTWLKKAVKWWAQVVGSLIGVKSYLLGEEGNPHLGNVEGNPEHFNQVNIGGRIELDWRQHQPYFRPSYFGLRITILLVCMSATLTLIAALLLSVPVFVGRVIIYMLFGVNGLVNSTSNDFIVHEVYTFSVGLYTCWKSVHVYCFISKWARRPWIQAAKKAISYCKLLLKCLILAVVVLGLLPLLLGILFDLVVVIPLRVPLHQTPVLVLWQDWALGVFLMKAGIATVLFGPTTWLKTDLDRLYETGLRRLDVVSFVYNTVVPVIYSILICLCIPYFVGHLIPLLCDCSLSTEYFLKWRTHSFLISGAIFTGICIYEARQLHTLCDRIKNERYLIGRRLQDYEPGITAQS